MTGDPRPRARRDATSPSETSLARSSAVMAAGTVVSRLLGFVRASMLAAAVGHRPGRRHLPRRQHPAQPVLPAAGRRRPQRRPGPPDHQGRAATTTAATSSSTGCSPLPRPDRRGDRHRHRRWPRWLVRLFSRRWDAEALGLATAFAFICLPQIFFYGLYTLLGQVLNARGQFAAYMWAPALANLVAIAGCSSFLRLYGTERRGHGVDPRRWSGCSPARPPWVSPPRRSSC